VRPAAISVFAVPHWNGVAGDCQQAKSTRHALTHLEGAAREIAAIVSNKPAIEVVSAAEGISVRDAAILRRRIGVRLVPIGARIRTGYVTAARAESATKPETRSGDFWKLGD
jgi:hypothetical protein